jgi:hypothetical protein
MTVQLDSLLLIFLQQIKKNLIFESTRKKQQECRKRPCGREAKAAGSHTPQPFHKTTFLQPLCVQLSLPISHSDTAGRREGNAPHPAAAVSLHGPRRRVHLSSETRRNPPHPAPPPAWRPSFSPQIWLRRRPCFPTGVGLLPRVARPVLSILFSALRHFRRLFFARLFLVSRAIQVVLATRFNELVPQLPSFAYYSVLRFCFRRQM